MRVLWFSNTPANSDTILRSELKGSGGWLKALDQALQSCIDLHIAFYGRDDSVFQYKNTVYYSMKNVSGFIHKFKRRFFGKRDTVDCLNKFLSIVDIVKPDVIHIHGTENLFGCIITAVNVPVVVSIQGNVTVVYHKYLSGFESKYLKVGIRKFSDLRSFIFPSTFIHQYLGFRNLRNVELFVLSNCKYIIGRTDWDRRIMRIMAPNSAYFYNNEILRESFYERSWQPVTNSKTVIFSTIGNAFYKGLETICEALHELNRIGFVCQWRVAGVRNSDLIVRITRRKLRYRFPEDGLIFLGDLNENELVDELLQSNMYVMPSHIENSPNSLSEAMILGLPCISTFVGGVSTLIKDNFDGILIQSGDPWCLAGAIIELSTSQDLAIRLGANARKTALKRHCKESITNELIGIYQKILDS